MPTITRYLLLLSSLLLLGCGGPSRTSTEIGSVALYTPRYASGFSIWGCESQPDAEGADTLYQPQSTLLKIQNPWQEAQGVDRSLFIARNGEEPPAHFEGQVLRGEARRIVCLSSSYVAMLDALGCVERVVGVSGIDFVANPYITTHREQIGDVGYDGNFNYELLVALDADLVLLYGVFGPSQMEPKLEELGIPYLYMGEYVEQSPLAKAEWLIALAEVVGQRAEAIRYIEQITPEYEAWREQATQCTTRPKVMLNTPYGDSWFMPSRSSYIARLIEDAGGEYLYHGNHSSGSQTIDLEQATLLTAEADFWLDVSNVPDRDALRRLYPRFANLRCVEQGALYNNDRRARPNGGNDYWESGVIHPHLILRDLVKILHPELVEEEFIYYRRLE